MLASLINQQFGRYVPTALIGRGGMAAVYRAHDPVLQRDVAIKVLYPHYADDQTIVERFKREAVTAAGLEHPNISSIYDVGEQDGMVYIAMKLLNGYTLHDVLNERGTLSLAELLPLLEQVASALSYAHASGVVHRDIKPSNIMLDAPAGARQVAQATAILTDFGIAKTLDNSGLTSTGALIGTPDYMAPEQIGNRPIDGRTDVYALGMLAFRALTGKPAFGGSTQEVLLGHLYNPPPLPSSLQPSLPPAVDAVLVQALAKDPDERFTSAEAFVEALTRASTDDATPVALPAAPPRVTALPVPVPSEPSPSAAMAVPPRHIPVWVVFSVALLVFALLGLLASLVFGGEGGGPEEPVGIGILPTPSENGVVGDISTVIIEPTATAESPTNLVATEPPEDVPAEASATTAPPPDIPGVPPAPTSVPAPAVPTTPVPVAPSPTNTPLPTSTATSVPVPSRTPTTPPQPIVTPDPCSDELLAGGFGFLYERNVEVRTKLGCPTGPLVPNRAVVQFFENGTMYWWEKTDTIYVFLGTTGGTYRQFARSDVAALPDPTPDPDSAVPMQGGFSRIYANLLDIQSALGPPRTPEGDLEPSGVRQPFEQGLMLFIPANTDPNNPTKLIFVLFANDNNAFTRYIDEYQD